MDFQEADRRYPILKRQYDNGDLSDEEFRAQLEQIAVQDAEGRWWAKHRDTGAWYYQEGDTWVQSIPPYPPYDKPTNSGDTGPGESEITVQESPPGWWVPGGITFAIVGFFIPYVGILLPLVGIYLGNRAVQKGKTTGGKVTIGISLICLILRFFMLLGAGL